MRSPVGGSAGLAGDARASRPRVFEPSGQTLDLGGFARTVEAFERDEETARHGLSLPPGGSSDMTAQTMAACGCVKKVLIFQNVTGVDATWRPPLE